ncbi:MAG: hypothetical protein WC907_02655 [Acholeplasmataceae bacterium]
MADKMTLDELIERSLSLATEVGNKKRQHELTKQGAEHLSARSLQELIESGALERTKVASKGQLDVARENTRGDMQVQMEQNRGRIDEKLIMNPLDELNADYARMKLDFMRDYGRGFQQAALDSAQAEAATRKRQAAGDNVDPESLLGTQKQISYEGMPDTFENVEAADNWLAEDAEKQRKKKTKDYLDFEPLFF